MSLWPQMDTARGPCRRVSIGMLGTSGLLRGGVLCSLSGWPCPFITKTASDPAGHRLTIFANRFQSMRLLPWVALIVSVAVANTQRNVRQDIDQPLSERYKQCETQGEEDESGVIVEAEHGTRDVLLSNFDSRSCTHNSMRNLS